MTRKLERILIDILLVGVVMAFLEMITLIWVIDTLSNPVINKANAALQEAAIDLQRQNMVLEDKIAEKSSLKVIEPKAQALGFTETKNVLWLDASNVKKSTLSGCKSEENGSSTTRKTAVGILKSVLGRLFQPKPRSLVSPVDMVCF